MIKQVKVFNAQYDVFYKDEIIDKVQTIVKATDKLNARDKIMSSFSCVYEDIRPKNIIIT